MERAMRLKIFARALLLQSCWSYERMQGVGLAYCLEPWLRRCYGGDAEGRLRALARHQEFFNTQPYMASFVIGALCGIEEESCRAAQGEDEGLILKIRALKSSVACALAAIGDALFWGALRSFCAALSGALAVCLWRLGSPRALFLLIPAAYLAAYDAPSLLLRWRAIKLGYERRERLVLALKDFPWQSWIRRLRWAGTALALTAVALMLTSPILAPSRRWEAGAAFAAAAATFKAVPGISAWKLYAAVCVMGCLAAAAGWAL